MAWHPIYSACSNLCQLWHSKTGWKKVLQLLLNIIAKALSGSDITCLFGKCSVSAFVHFAEKIWVLRYYLRIHKNHSNTDFNINLGPTALFIYI